MGNMFQDLPQLRETADNNKRFIQGDQKVSVHLMITIQKVTSEVSRLCSLPHGAHSECILCWPSSNHRLCGDCFYVLQTSGSQRLFDHPV
jgi:hypothetical protein